MTCGATPQLHYLYMYIPVGGVWDKQRTRVPYLLSPFSNNIA